MPLTGTLAEFPLPEVLLLIGCRTGRLRLYGAADFVPMEIDLSEGQAHGLHIGKALVTVTPQIVAELSLLVESGDGMFEFAAQPIVSVPREDPLPISELVMLLVLHVNESWPSKTRCSRRSSSICWRRRHPRPSSSRN